GVSNDDDPGRAVSLRPGQCGIELVRTRDGNEDYIHSKRASRALDILSRLSGLVWVGDEGEPRGRRGDLAEELDVLLVEASDESGQPGDVGLRPRQVRHNPLPDGVVYDRKHNRDR